MNGLRLSFGTNGFGDHTLSDALAAPVGVSEQTCWERLVSDIRCPGLVSVELPRHSHAGPDVARRSLRFLRQSLRDRALRS